MNYRYVIFYKPYNVVSQFSGDRPSTQNLVSQPSQPSTRRGDPDQPPSTLKNFISIPDVYPVGRLDRDSEGLMLLTNHGRIQHRLSHPRYGHPRTYWVQVEYIPSPQALEQLRRGITIRGYRTRPCRVTQLEADPPLPPRVPPIRERRAIPTAWLEMTLTEGKNRQVRRMTAAVGYPTLRLVRVAIAHLSLGALQPGEWRELTQVERQALLSL
ncbi:pseudouridine synthase [Nodosilinea sp. P-1105]|uniref:pseudouridine synthase n=1 Tax=Nodosilinea sp. P-1105 TaxID=2546229 RepID=UPI00146ECF9C|nr:pseudouridine synthase [Nodosilinea sp. P-1105]NMF86131.1 pseudouridine synthase [Nodosilinea sp. P-1105]